MELSQELTSEASADRSYHLPHVSFPLPEFTSLPKYPQLQEMSQKFCWTRSAWGLSGREREKLGLRSSSLGDENSGKQGGYAGLHRPVPGR